MRELYEEAGISVGTSIEAASQNALPFRPDLSNLRFLARAITPAGMVRRFDTRFFLVEAEAIRHKIGDIVSPDSELVELAWLTIEETKSQPLPVITRIVLGDLEARLTGGELGTAAPVPFYYRIGKDFRRDLIAV